MAISSVLAVPLWGSHRSRVHVCRFDGVIAHATDISDPEAIVHDAPVRLELDWWGTPLQSLREHHVFFALSAGPDRRWGTEDDIVAYETTDAAMRRIGHGP